MKNITNITDFSPRALQAVVDADVTLRSEMRREAASYGARPVVVQYGTHGPEERGHGYYFRWLGRWKTAPGSYQASTRRVSVGHRWLAAYLAAGRDAGAADRAVARIASRARGHLRRWLSGWRRKQERREAPKTAVQRFAAYIREHRNIRWAIDPVVGEAISVAWPGRARGDSIVHRAHGGRRLQSARLRAVQACQSATGGCTAEWCWRAETTLERYRSRLRDTDVAALEELLARQEIERRETLEAELSYVRAARTAGQLQAAREYAERYTMSGEEREALQIAIAAGRRNVAAHTVREVEPMALSCG